MRAARLHDYTTDVKNAFAIEKVDRPTIEIEDEVLVRVEAAGWCQTDNHIVEGRLDEMVSLPHVPGHENVGEVEAVGDAVTSVSPGDRVVVMGAVPCQICRPCRRGDDYGCRNLEIVGISRPGGFAEYLVVPERSVVVTESDPATAAPYGDAGLTSYSAAKKASRRLDPVDVALVLGVGGLGHVGLQNLQALSPATVVAVDVRNDAVALAERLGADVAVDASREDVSDRIDTVTEGEGVAQAIDFAGTADSFETALSVLSVGGDLHVVGYGATVDLPLQELTTRDVSLVGNRVGTFTELQEFVALADAGQVTVVTESYDLAEINAVAERLASGEILGRAVLEP